MPVRPAKWFPFLIMTIALVMAASPPAEVPVESAIEKFETPWKPPKDVLRGWTIAIDPGDAACDASDRRAADRSLLTSAHLYHFLKQAGAAALLARVDDGLARGEESPKTRAEITRDSGCDVCVQIRHAAGDDAARVYVPLAAPADGDGELAKALATALDRLPGPPVDDAGDDPFTVLLRPADKPATPALARVEFDNPQPKSAISIDDRRACFDHARRVFEGLRSYCAEQQEPGENTAWRSAPEPGSPIAGVDGDTARVARTIWPGEKLPLELASWFCGRYIDTAVTDRSLVYLNIEARTAGEAVVLVGQTNVPALVTGLEEALQAVGVTDVRGAVRTLPARETLGDEMFGVCSAPFALTYNRAEPGGGLQTQILFGEPVFLLDATDSHFLLHAGDGYWGWVPREAITTLTAAEFGRYIQQPRAGVMTDIENGSLRIPRGATVRVVATKGDESTIWLPSGKMLVVPATAVHVDEGDMARAAQRVQAALELLYTPYVFGGRSPLGLDCSGLITSVMARRGEQPARDAWQQALAGGLVATSWHRADLRAGDLLYFINTRGKVYHTGIALDETHFVHSAPPCVQISSFDPADPLYDESHVRDFFLAKRP